MQLEKALAALGFETVSVRGLTNYRLGNRYIRFSFGDIFAVVEIAHGRENAEKNLYEDLDLYEYDYMESRNEDIFGAIKSGIIKFVVEREEQQ